MRAHSLRSGGMRQRAHSSDVRWRTSVRIEAAPRNRPTRQLSDALFPPIDLMIYNDNDDHSNSTNSNNFFLIIVIISVIIVVQMPAGAHLAHPHGPHPRRLLLPRRPLLLVGAAHARAHPHSHASTHSPEPIQTHALTHSQTLKNTDLHTEDHALPPPQPPPPCPRPSAMAHAAIAHAAIAQAAIAHATPTCKKLTKKTSRDKNNTD